jgi:hypothetical protein
MSQVTTFVLAFDVAEDIESRTRDLNNWLTARGHEEAFAAQDGFGGNKNSETVVLGLSTSYLIDDDFVQMVRNIKWDYLENVTLVIYLEDRIPRLCGGTAAGWDKKRFEI